jgi:hypothetical protein
MLHRNFAEEIKTHILLNKSFSENQTVYEIMCEKYGKSAQATDGSTVRRVVCVCWITKTQKHTQIM